MKTTGLVVLTLAVVLAVVFVMLRFRTSQTAPGYSTPTVSGDVSTRGGVPAAPRSDSAEQGIAAPARMAEIVVAPAATGSSARAGGVAFATARDRDRMDGEHLLSFFSRDDREAFAGVARGKGAMVLDTSDFMWSLRVRERDPATWQAILAEAPKPTGGSANYLVRPPQPPFPKPAPPDEMPVPFGNTALRWMGVPRDNTQWGKGVKVAVLDSGVRDHPALPGSVERVDLINENSGDTGAVHGTAVASLISGQSAGLPGMAPAAGILSVKVLPDNGPGDVFTLVKGIIAAVDRGARVVNLSLGTRGDSFLLKEAIGYAAGKGVIVVAAAGNDGSAASLYPAAYDGVVAVTAVDTEGNRAFFSNTGNASSISAPGMGLLAAAPGDKAGLFSGTSAAAPLVSGAAAMVLSRDQGLSASEVMDLLRRCSDDAGMPGRDAEYGSGILNMDRLSRWQERGVIDVAAGRPQVEFPRAGTGDMVVHVYAQNRGTEVLPQVTLELVINQSARHVWSFRDVGVGQTVSEILRTEMSAWKNIGDLPIRVTATSVNLRDVNPANNTVSVSIVTAK